MCQKSNKSLYRLKLAPRLGYDKLKMTLECFGFKQSDFSECVFKYKDNKIDVGILVYVDDLVVLTAEIDDIGSVKCALKSLFKLTGLGELKYYRGLRSKVKTTRCSYHNRHTEKEF